MNICPYTTPDDVHVALAGPWPYRPICVRHGVEWVPTDDGVTCGYCLDRQKSPINGE